MKNKLMFLFICLLLILCSCGEPQNNDVKNDVEEQKIVYVDEQSNNNDNNELFMINEQKWMLSILPNRILLKVGQNRQILSSFYLPLFNIEYNEDNAIIKYEQSSKLIPNHYDISLLGKEVGCEYLTVRSKIDHSLIKEILIEVKEYVDYFPNIPDYLIFDANEGYVFDVTEEIIVEICNGDSNGADLNYKDGKLFSNGIDSASKIKISSAKHPTRYKYIFAYSVNFLAETYYETYYEEKIARYDGRTEYGDLWKDTSNELLYLKNKTFYVIDNKTELFEIYFYYTQTDIPNKLLNLNYEEYNVLLINEFHNGYGTFGTMYSNFIIDNIQENFSINVYRYDGESGIDAIYPTIEFVIIPKKDISNELNIKDISKYSYNFNDMYYHGR